MGQAFWVESCLCQNPEVQGVASLEAELQFCSSDTAPSENVRKSRLPSNKRGSFYSILPPCLLIKRVSCGRDQPKRTYSKTDALTSAQRNRSLMALSRSGQSPSLPPAQN